MREAPSASGATHAQIPMIYRPQLRQTRRAGLSWPRPWTVRIEPTRRTDAMVPVSGTPRGGIARRPAALNLRVTARRSLRKWCIPTSGNGFAWHVKPASSPN